MAHPYVALLVLGGLGLLDALYFSLVSLGWMRADARFVPRFCRMEESACRRIVDTRWGRLFGVPNSHLGFAWYLLLVVAAGYGAWTGRIPYCKMLLVAAGIVLALSVLLAWSLLVRLKVACVLCFAAHAINLAVVIILLALCG